jgi:hypothetical protein
MSLYESLRVFEGVVSLQLHMVYEHTQANPAEKLIRADDDDVTPDATWKAG